MKPLADPAAKPRTKSQARRGLAIYFALLIPLSAVFETLMIVSDLSWFWVLMWVPAAASIGARLVLREGSPTCRSGSAGAGAVTPSGSL
jgi:hypothetical protein